MFKYEHIGAMGKYRIPSLERACHVLELISDTSGACRLKDISEGLKIPRTTALRITQTFLESQFLEQSEDGGFTLGTALVQLGVKALDSLDIRGFARPVLKALSADTGESSHLAMLNGNKSLLVAVADSAYPIRIASRPGTLVDLHSSATGKVFLAYSVPEARRFCETLGLKPHTENTDSTIEAVQASIERTRRQGYALDDEEYVPGVRCIATPVTNAFGKTIAAVGITASTSTFTRVMIPAMAKRIVTAAAEISTNMGFDR